MKGMLSISWPCFHPWWSVTNTHAPGRKKIISTISQVLKEELPIIAKIRSFFYITSHFGLLFVEEVKFEHLIGDERKQSSVSRRRLDVVH